MREVIEPLVESRLDRSSKEAEHETTSLYYAENA